MCSEKIWWTEASDMLQIFGTKFYFPRLVPKRTCCEALFLPASGKNKGCTYAPRDQGEQMQILRESLQAKRENTLTPNYELIISQSLTDLEGSSNHDFMYLQSLRSFLKDWGFCQIWCLLYHASDVSSCKPEKVHNWIPTSHGCMGLAQPGPAIFAQRWRGRWAAGHACAPRISSMCFFSTSRQAYVGKDHLLQQFHFSWFSYGHFFLKKNGRQK